MGDGRWMGEDIVEFGGIAFSTDQSIKGLLAQCRDRAGQQVSKSLWG